MRRSALLLIPATALALTACGSDSTDGAPSAGSSAKPSSQSSQSSSATTTGGTTGGTAPACSSAKAPITATPTPAGSVLCLKTYGISPLGTSGGVVRIVVKTAYQAESYSLDQLEVPAASKQGKALWFADVSASIIKAGADLEDIDPAQAMTIRYAGDRAGTTARGVEPGECPGNTFNGSTEGATMTSCAWALLPAGQQPTSVVLLGRGGTTPTVTWAPKD